MNKLWLQISLTFLLLLTFVLAGVGFFIGDVMKRTYMDMSRHQLSQDADLVYNVVSPKDVLDESPAIQGKIQNFYKDHQPRITIINAKGKVLADSKHDPETMENHSQRPEFLGVMAQGKKSSESIRYSKTLGYSMMYMAKPIVYHGKTIGVVRVAFALDSMERVLKNLWISFGFAMAITLILSALIGIRMAKGFTRPIEAIIEVAQRLTKKDYHSRVTIKTTGEMEQLADAVNELARSLQTQMEEIRENQQRLTGVLSNMVSGVMLINTDGRIMLVNRAMEEMIASTSKKLMGKLHIEAGKNFGLSQLIGRSLKEGISIHEEVHVYFPAERILDAHVAPSIGENGEIKGVISVLHDITEIRRLENMRSEFVANVSHELKTPVTSLKGFTETLLDGAMHDEEVLRSFLTIMLEESERLHRLIADILDLSKIEQHRLPLNPVKLDIVNVIQETVSTLREEANKKNLVIELPGVEGLIMEADKDRLQQIILNLVANALAYTPEGGTITVEVKDKGEEVELAVKDTGIGISKQDLPRIFERFYRVDKARSRQSGGTGLGLAIVKHLVESHHGHIKVESEEGEGTSFIITFPKIQS
jgi:two-component system, OmpR family, phosphate regulon sensor histidine kinase PhoR